jgi:hypothetical protein
VKVTRVLLDEVGSFEPRRLPQINRHLPDECLSFSPKPVVMVETKSVTIKPRNPYDRPTK